MHQTTKNLFFFIAGSETICSLMQNKAFRKFTNIHFNHRSWNRKYGQLCYRYAHACTEQKVGNVYFYSTIYSLFTYNCGMIRVCENQHQSKYMFLSVSSTQFFSLSLSTRLIFRSIFHVNEIDWSKSFDFTSHLPLHGTIRSCVIIVAFIYSFIMFVFCLIFSHFVTWITFRKRCTVYMSVN